MMETWYFTFCGNDPVHGGYCQPIKAKSSAEARFKMCELYGRYWAFQYSEAQWVNWKNTKPTWMPIERELELIVVEV